MSEKTTENEMSFLGHLEELRWRLVRSVIVILIIAVVLFYFTDPIVKLVYLNMSKTNFPTYHFFCFYIQLMINFINSIADTNVITDKSIYQIEFIKKTFSEIRKKDENKLLMYLGLFIIIQTIMLILFFINLRLIIKLKNISKKILNF